MGRIIENIDVSTMLISPPPEEILRPGGKHPSSHGRSASTQSQSSLVSTPATSSKRKPSKRKRFGISNTAPDPSEPISSNAASSDAIIIDGRAQTVEVTPNPKPRKQSKRHTHNLSNDRKFPSFRRSATPVPAYEPPRERFTPPREVFVTPIASNAPRVSKSSKRKSTVKDLKLVIKTEPPDVTFLPLPPPSPTDDPLLLSGPIQELPRRSGSSYSKSRTNNRILPSPLFQDKNSQLFTRDSRSLTSMSPVEASPLDTSAIREASAELNSQNDTASLPSFDLDVLPTSNGWSDSDSDSDSEASNFNQSGEYTGKFTTMEVPTKVDSPTSGTRGRIFRWGRPVSPFPGNKRSGAITPRVEEESEDEEMESGEAEIVDNLQDQVDEETRNSYNQPDEPSFEETSSGDLWSKDVQVPSLATIDNDNRMKRLLTNGKEQDPPGDSLRVKHQELYLHHDGPDDMFYVGQPQLAEDLGIPSQSPAEQNIGRLSAETREDCPRQTSVSPLPHNTALTSTHQPIDEVISGSDDDESDSDGDNSVETSLIKISSGDPRAAARAAAILKQHDYDCFIRTSMKRRHSSHVTIDSVSRNARRKDVSKSGINKAINPRFSQQRRRVTLGGVIGDQVFIPGSPVTSLPELLKEAEVGLVQTTSNLPVVRHSFETPTPAPPEYIVSNIGSGEPQYPFGNPTNNVTREWTRDDWKRLDTCFTEERFDIGKKLELADDTLADVNDVQIGDVVTRFVQKMGGTEVVEVLGPEWSFDRLSARVSALQKKQRSGSLAPSSPEKHLPTSTSIMDVPDFTPLPRRLPSLHKSRPILPPAVADFPFNEFLSDELILHPSLEAARHFPEANSINDERPREIQPSTSIGVPVPTSEQTTHEEPPNIITQPPPASIGKRMKGFLFSYLPLLSKSVTPPQQCPLSRPSLPLPPREVLEKPRGHISTPARPLVPKPIPPKELVHLQPAPASQVSMIPRASKPQRLVNLRPLSPQSTEPVPIPRPRRSSGGSVKDLIKNFEERQAVSRKGLNVKSKGVRGINDFSQRKCMESRPAWKP